MCSTSKPFLSIGIAIVRNGDSFLVGTRTSGQDLEGFAEFPGGKCFEGELPQHCVIRECREETGLSVHASVEYEIVKHEYDHANVELHFWICELEKCSKETLPAGNFHWVSFEELSKLNFPDANATVISKLINANN